MRVKREIKKEEYSERKREGEKTRWEREKKGDSNKRNEKVREKGDSEKERERNSDRKMETEGKKEMPKEIKRQ